MYIHIYIYISLKLLDSPLVKLLFGSPCLTLAVNFEDVTRIERLVLGRLLSNGDGGICHCKGPRIIIQETSVMEGNKGWVQTLLRPLQVDNFLELFSPIP